MHKVTYSSWSSRICSQDEVKIIFMGVHLVLDPLDWNYRSSILLLISGALQQERLVITVWECKS